MEQKNPRLRNVGFITFFFSGICAISSGVVVSLLQEQYGFAYGMTGTLLSLMSIGNLLAGFLIAMLPGKLGMKPSILLLTIGYALGYAVKMGYKVCIITGGRGKTLENRLRMLGINRYYTDCMDKITAMREYFADEGIDPAHAIYMGDDIPDLECMREVGIPVCPADAAAEVIEASRYVSEFRGGEGAVRDIVEQVLRARGDWAKNSEGVTPSSLAASR